MVGVGYDGESWCVRHGVFRNGFLGAKIGSTGIVDYSGVLAHSDAHESVPGHVSGTDCGPGTSVTGPYTLRHLDPTAERTERICSAQPVLSR